MGLVPVERRDLIQIVYDAVHSHPDQSSFADLREYLRMFPFLPANERSEEHYFGSLRQFQQALLNLLQRLLANRLAAKMALHFAGASKKQPQIIVNLGRRGDGAARVRVPGSLVDADDRRKPADRIHVRPLELIEELPGVRAQTFDILSLPLGIDRIERQAALPRPAGAGDDDQLAQRNVETDILEVVRASPADAEEVEIDGRATLLGLGHHFAHRQKVWIPTTWSSVCTR